MLNQQESKHADIDCASWLRGSGTHGKQITAEGQAQVAPRLGIQAADLDSAAHLVVLVLLERMPSLMR